MKFGLQKRDIDTIVEALRTFEEIQEAIIFGSRAQGDNQAGSDVDIAVKGSMITDPTLSSLKTLLEEESPLPYYFDIVHYEKIHNRDLIDHIDRVGQVIYHRG